jgi:hypothetical protein
MIHGVVLSSFCLLSSEDYSFSAECELDLPPPFDMPNNTFLFYFFETEAQVDLPEGFPGFGRQQQSRQRVKYNISTDKTIPYIRFSAVMMLCSYD